MALTSPGVEVTIIDQSQYLPAAGASVPFVMIATASNKRNPNGAGLAQGTVPANAGKLYQVTSQRDLTTLYGNPFFYTTSDGTPIQGYELNEYGLLAAYSALGVTNNCYVLRADIDLASLIGQTGRPTGDPEDGTYWLDTTSTTWGIYAWNAKTQAFSYKTPILINSSNQMSGTTPSSSVGNIGDFAVVELAATNVSPSLAQKTFFQKSPNNVWNPIGSYDWMNGVATVTGTESDPSLSIGDSLTITASNGATFTVTTVATTVASLAGLINSIAIYGVKAAKNATTGALELYSAQVYGQEVNSPPNSITISGTGTLLDDLGIDAGTYYQPQVVFGTSAQMPLWQAGQDYPAPTGSVWMKISTATNGLNPVVKSYDATTGVWVTRNCTLATDDWVATEGLDPTGGQAIPAGTVYAQYNPNGNFVNGPLYIWKRLATGPTIVVGNDTDVTFASGTNYAGNVYVSTPGNKTLDGPYAISVDATGGAKTASDFVTAWSAADIPYTTAAVNDDGAIVLTHTEGGEIVLDDFMGDNSSSNLFYYAGFVKDVTDYVKVGPPVTAEYDVATTTVTGAGSGLKVYITTQNGRAEVDATSFSVAGTGYAVNDTVKVLGGAIGGSTPANDIVLKVLAIGGGGAVTRVAITTAGYTAPSKYATLLSNWIFVDYVPNEGAPTENPADFTNWFYSVVDQVDIMVNTASADPATGSTWKGYGNVAYDDNGFPKPSGTNATDPNGPIISASEPTSQSDGTDLEPGDLWIDTGDLENYPLLYRYQLLKDKNGNPTTEFGWVLIDTTDQTSSSGIVFADARWAPNGTTNPANDPIPSIKTLLTSNYLDLDAPESSLYPVGMLLFNTRRSGYNVKQYRINYLTQSNFPDMPTPPGYPSETATWVSSSGLQADGKAYMGRKAQRNMVVKAMRSTMDTNQDVRDEDNFFNLMCTPNYTELQPNMVVLNNDRGQTGYILGDTPLGLPMQATEISKWANLQPSQGGPARDTYLGLFYPSGLGVDLSGNEVVVPPSHMMLRTFLRNDTIAYPWLAAAGTRRGLIDNALGIGWLDRDTGEFQVTKTPLGIRNVLYNNFINPLVFFTGNGLLNYGNKTSFNSQSALDRTNVARLVAYIRRQLTIAARPFVFEPNDAITRQQISAVIDTLFVDLVAKRGIYDYIVVCDESNNTPARIDRSELWVDVAVEPVKAAEFIYIPVRILNTGELSQ